MKKFRISYEKENEKLILGFSLWISVLMFGVALYVASKTGGLGIMIEGWTRILMSPSPLITDYFKVGGISGTFFNAGICTFVSWLFIYLTRSRPTASLFSAYILLVAHCFYGMNFVNIWPCFFGVILVFVIRKIDFRENLHMAMLAMSFGPLVSELIWRYPLGEKFQEDAAHLTWQGIVITFVMSMVIGFLVPAMLQGSTRMHKGYNLYNAGLAFGLVGIVIYAFLFKTMGITAGTPVELRWDMYDGIGREHLLFINAIFIFFFLSAAVTGYIANEKSFKGYKSLFFDPGHQTNFTDIYGMPKCLLNIAFYGFMVLAYMNIVFLITDGVFFTGPTVGAILAALAFSTIGQTPKNTLPIFCGYFLLYIVVYMVSVLRGVPVPWTLSTQGYINGVAFATGLGPITGKYNRRAGVAAGFISATICTSTAAFHGGFMIFNGGFSAGLTALILTSLFDYYLPNYNK